MRAKNNRAINGEKNQEFRESDALLLVFPSFHFFVSWVGKTCVWVSYLQKQSSQFLFTPPYFWIFSFPLFTCACVTQAHGFSRKGKKVPKSTKNLPKSEM